MPLLQGPGHSTEPRRYVPGRALMLLYRWLRPSLQCHHRVAPVRLQNAPCTPPARQLGAQGRDRGHPRVDAQMLHTGAVGEGTGDDAVAEVCVGGMGPRRKQSAEKLVTESGVSGVVAAAAF